MPRTPLEKRLIQRRRAQGILVPLLEDMFATPLRLDTADAAFIHWLIDRNADREVRRKQESAFSPSELGSCLRRVYLNRNARRLGIEKVFVPRVEVSGYFYDGEFEHIKWQAAIRKLAMRVEELELVGGTMPYPGFEIPVKSKRGDHQGTIDVLIRYKGVPYIVDVKGLNVRGFQQATRGQLDPKYPIQTADYMMLANSQRKRIIPERIENAIVLVKSKGGPDPTHPLALHEVLIPLEKHLSEVQLRLETLRAAEEEGSIPEPECTTTQGIQFQGCAFSGFCRAEVKKIQKLAKDRDTTELQISRPSGRHSARRPRSAGGKRKP